MSVVARYRRPLARSIAVVGFLCLVRLLGPKKFVQSGFGVLGDNQPLLFRPWFFAFLGGLFHVSHDTLKAVTPEGFEPSNLDQAPGCKPGLSTNSSTGPQVLRAGAGRGFNAQGRLCFGRVAQPTLKPSSFATLLLADLYRRFEVRDTTLEKRDVCLSQVRWILDESTVKPRDWEAGKALRHPVSFRVSCRWSWWGQWRRWRRRASSRCTPGSAPNCAADSTAHALEMRRHSAPRLLQRFQIETNRLIHHLPSGNTGIAKAFLNLRLGRGPDVHVSHDWRIASLHDLTKGGLPAIVTLLASLDQPIERFGSLSVVAFHQAQKPERSKESGLVASGKVRQHAPVEVVRDCRGAELLHELVESSICTARRRFSHYLSLPDDLHRIALRSELHCNQGGR